MIICMNAGQNCRGYKQVRAKNELFNVCVYIGEAPYQQQVSARSVSLSDGGGWW